MVMKRAIPSIKKYNLCQFTLDYFVSVAGISLRPTLRSTTSNVRPKDFPRRFSAFQSRRSETREKLTEEEESQIPIEEKLFDREPAADLVNIKGETSIIPWYLQVQTPEPALSPLSERQRLPDLPPNPPSLLQPILERLSIDIGLDDLTLIDLRKLDPPPALGSNLIMLMGTARSEKHLHVSADRFCRWLRTSHKLTPFADGLLGRNELKLKLRRKARRAKLLGSVGNTEVGSQDDGIRTGWVCVNIGSIEDGKDIIPEDDPHEGFVGFGGHSYGTKLVIQMLTEEKREELDLESLWGGFIRRQQRKEAREAENVTEDVRDGEVGRQSIGSSGPKTDRFLVTALSPITTTSSSLAQYRDYHTSTRLLSQTPETDTILDNEDLESQSVKPKTSLPSSAQEKSYRGTHSKALRVSTQQLGLSSHIEYLQSLPQQAALDVLGKGFEDFDSTSFLVSFYQNFPLFPETGHWECRFTLASHALNLGHPGYTVHNLVWILQQMQSSAIVIPPTLCEDTISFLLVQSLESPVMITSGKKFMQSVVTALDLIEDMNLRGNNIFTEPVFEALLIAIARTWAVKDNFGSMNLPTFRSEGFERFRQLMFEKGVQFSKLDSHFRILQACSLAGSHELFWIYWCYRCWIKPPEVMRTGIKDLDPRNGN